MNINDLLIAYATSVVTGLATGMFVCITILKDYKKTISSYEAR